MKRRYSMLWNVYDRNDDFNNLLWWGHGWGWIRRGETDAPMLSSSSMHHSRKAAERSGSRLAARGGDPVLVQTCLRVSRKHPKGWDREWGMR
jgi:hypothetical protein